MALPPLISLPAGSAFAGQVLTVAGLNLADFDYELVLVDAQGVEITPLVSTVGLGVANATTPGGSVAFADLVGQPDSNPALKAEFATYAPLDSPHLFGDVQATTPALSAVNDEVATAAWVRALLLSQLGLSPFSGGGGRILYVCGRGQATPGEAGNPNRPFASLPAAHSVAAAGDTVIVLPGGTGQDSFGRVYYMEAYTQTRPLNVHFAPGAIYGADIYVGAYGGSAPASHYLSGGEFLARILQARQSGGQSQVLVENAKFTGALGGVQYVANLPGGDGGPHVDQFITRGSIFDSKRSAGNSAPIRNNGTQSFGNCDMLIDSCLVMTTETPCAIYSSREGGSIQFLGTTECRPGGGQPVLQSLAPNGGGLAVPEAQWFRDLRPHGQVRVGTDTVLRFTQPATYAAISSGTFTVNTAGAEPGVVVFAELAAGATQPSLSAQFELVGGSYQSGKRLGYAFQVMPSGQIEYLIYVKP